jgi:hypothetical protein
MNWWGCGRKITWPDRKHSADSWLHNVTHSQCDRNSSDKTKAYFFCKRGIHILEYVMKYTIFQQFLLHNTYAVLSLEQNSDFALSESSVIPAIMPSSFNPCQRPVRTTLNCNQHYVFSNSCVSTFFPLFLGTTMKTYIASQMKTLQMRTNKGWGGLQLQMYQVTGTCHKHVPCVVELELC